MLRIKLLGELADLFISEFLADVRTTAEVIDCLKSNFTEFEKYVVEAAERGLGFIVTIGNQVLDDENKLSHPFSSKVQNFTLSVVPVGSGGGFGKILLGVAIIGVGLLTGGAGFLGISTASLYLTGGALILGGISELFGKNKTGPTDKDTKKSLVFNGGAQTVTEGSRIPLCYGKHRVGLFVVSSRAYSYAY